MRETEEVAAEPTAQCAMRCHAMRIIGCGADLAAAGPVPAPTVGMVSPFSPGRCAPRVARTLRGSMPSFRRSVAWCSCPLSTSIARARSTYHALTRAVHCARVMRSAADVAAAGGSALLREGGGVACERSHEAVGSASSQSVPLRRCLRHGQRFCTHRPCGLGEREAGTAVARPGNAT